MCNLYAGHSSLNAVLSYNTYFQPQKWIIKRCRSSSTTKVSLKPFYTFRRGGKNMNENGPFSRTQFRNVFKSFSTAILCLSLTESGFQCYYYYCEYLPLVLCHNGIPSLSFVLFPINSMRDVKLSQWHCWKKFTGLFHIHVHVHVQCIWSL